MRTNWRMSSKQVRMKKKRTLLIDKNQTILYSSQYLLMIIYVMTEENRFC